MYRVYKIGGKTFVIRYGYYSEAERLSDQDGENLLPIFPDFSQNPEYADSGYPFAVDIDEPCEHYKPRSPRLRDDLCQDCVYFPEDKPQLGICRCEARRIKAADAAN